MVAWKSVRQFLSGARIDDSSKPPVMLEFRSSAFLIILTVSLATFTDMFYYALIVPVIPFSLTSRVGIPEDQVQHWTSILLACYAVALVVGSPIVGDYADRTSSRRWPFLIGLVALAASTFLLCFGNTIGLLVVGRILQGFSASIVWTVGCALLVDTMGRAIGMAMGYLAIGMSLGLLVGPSIGGAVYAAVGYYAVFYIAFGVVAFDIFLRLFMIEKKVARQWLQDGRELVPPPARTEKSASGGEKAAQAPAIPAEGGADQITAAEPLAAEGPVQRDTNTSVENEITATTANPTQVPPTKEKASKHAIVELIKSKRLIAAVYGFVVAAGLLTAFDAVLTIFVEETFGWNSTAAGLMLLPLYVPGFASPIAGWLADRYGAKWPSLIGFCCVVPLMVCLRFVDGDTLRDKVLLVVILSLLGINFMFANTPLMAEISYSIDEIERIKPGIFGEKGAYGIGYGLFTMAFALGGVIGPLWAGYVTATAGWATMGWSFGLWSASAAVVIFFWAGGKVPKDTSDEENQGSTAIASAN